MNKPLTVTPRRSRVHTVHLAPRSAAIPALHLLGICAAIVVLVTACGGSADDTTADQAALVEQGRQTFRYETFGDEAKWTDTLRMHEVISAAVDPVTALSVGLKVDAQALPAAVVDGSRPCSAGTQSRRASARHGPEPRTAPANRTDRRIPASTALAGTAPCAAA